MNPRFFTVEEADRLVSFLETTFERLTRNRQAYRWLEKEISILELIVECGADSDNPDAIELEEKTRKLNRVAAQIEKDISAVREKGCVIKDIDRGLVDFYSIQNGTVVFLCWQLGEDRIQYWHSINDGFKGRQLLTRSPSA